jgi:hypothetical protein
VLSPWGARRGDLPRHAADGDVAVQRPARARLRSPHLAGALPERAARNQVRRQARAADRADARGAARAGVDCNGRGAPTDPARFHDTDLLEREASYGRSGFALQFMLDTSVSDGDRYPLKLSDLVVMAIDPKWPR